MPIGAYTSQPLGALAASAVDHEMKERVKAKFYVRYCDDTSGLAATKAEAWRQLREYAKLSEEYGFCVKANYIIAPLGLQKRNERKAGRKRKRGKGKGNGLPRLLLHGRKGEAAQEHKAALRAADVEASARKEAAEGARVVPRMVQVGGLPQVVEQVN